MVNVWVFNTKLAVTLLLASMLKEQTPAPAQEVPDHPVKVLPLLGVAFKFTTTPLLKIAVQVVPQVTVHNLTG